MTCMFLGGKNWFAVLLALFLVLSISGTVTSFAAEKGSISGTVIDEASKTPLPGIAVTVDGTDIIVYTNEKGEYEIGLKPGIYKLRAELLGYKPSEALNVTVLEGETTRVNLKMAEALAIKGEEVVVTGERLTVPLSKTTASVSVVSPKEIEKVPVATNAADLLAYTPGVQMESGSSAFTKTIKIRGRTATPPRTATSGILLLVDGIPSNDPASGYANIYQIPSENIERIEVVKGASSAQYGGQAAAGVINIITRKGQAKPYTSAAVSLGTYQRRSGAERELYESYSFSHSWGNKYFDYALSGSYAHSSGITSADTNKVGSAYSLFAKSHPGQGRLPDGTKVLPTRKEIPFMLGKNINELFDVGDHDKAERYSASASIGINLFKGNTLRINPSHSYLSSYSIFSPGNIPLTKASDTFLQSELSIKNRRDTLNMFDKWEINPNLTYNFRMGLIKSTDIVNFIFINDFIDYTKEEEAISGLKDGFANGSNSAFSPALDFMLNRSFNFANDLSYKFNVLDGDTVTIGQEYQFTKSYSPIMSYISPSVSRKVNSLFFQNILVIKNLTFSAGGRWDQAQTLLEEFDDEFSPRVGFNYEISPGTSLRFSVGRARSFPEFARSSGLHNQMDVLSGTLIWDRR